MALNVSLTTTPQYIYYGLTTSDDWFEQGGSEPFGPRFNKEYFNITGTGDFYIIPIFVHQASPTKLTTTHYIIPEQELELIKDNKAVVLFDYAYEHFLSTANKQLIINTINKYNLDYNSVVFYSFNYSDIHPEFRTVYFHWVLYHKEPLTTEVVNSLTTTTNRPKKLLMFCRKFIDDTNCRKAVGQFIFDNNMQHDNIITMPNVDNPITEFEKSLPWVYDINCSKDSYYRQNSNIVFKQPNNAYSETYISVVLESLFVSNSNTASGVDISEKISHPIKHLHPFIIHGQCGYLKQLKSLGFKTFDKWWDESYDHIENDKLRQRAILKLIKKLSTKSFAELDNMYKEMIPILKHNESLFRSNYINKIYTNNLHKCVNEVILLKSDK
jgi:hypothetical protein